MMRSRRVPAGLRRRSVPAARAAALALLAVSACSRPEGVQTPSPALVATVASTTAAPAPTLPPTPTRDPLAACPVETQGMRLYLSLGNGFCFLYPAHYELRHDLERPEEAITLVGPLADPQALETIGVVLSVAFNGPSEGMTSPQYAARWREIHQAPPEVPEYAETIGGRPAWTVNGLPGYGTERRSFVIVDGFRYSLLLTPVPEDVPVLTEEANLIWEAVTGSLAFFPPQASHDYVQAEEVCPAATDSARLYTSLKDGYCLLYPADFEPDADSLQDATIGGAPAVVFRDPRGPWASRQAIIVYRDFAYTIVAQPWEPERFPSGIEFLDRVWDTVTGSPAFFNRWN